MVVNTGSSGKSVKEPAQMCKGKGRKGRQLQPEHLTTLSGDVWKQETSSQTRNSEEIFNKECQDRLDALREKRQVARYQDCGTRI